VDEAAASDPCPHIKAATGPSGLHGFHVPYRIAMTKYGLGVFTLRDIKKGEVVFKDLEEGTLYLTGDNWRRQIKKHIEQGSWWNDPEIAAAKRRLMVDGKLPKKAVPEVMKMLLKKDWGGSVGNEDEEGTYEMPLDDGRYVNFARLKRSLLTEGASLVQVGSKEEEEEKEASPSLAAFSRRGGVARSQSLHEEAEDEEEDDDDDEDEEGDDADEEEAPAASLVEEEEDEEEDEDEWRQEVEETEQDEVALRDIPACTEITEDYGETFAMDGDDWSDPEWFLELLDKWGIEDNFDPRKVPYGTPPGMVLESDLDDYAM